MNSDHAPTAEEQLPPLDREHTYYDPITSEDDSQCLEQTGEFEIRILREDQLLAALRENREKDAQLKQLHELWGFQVDRTIERDKALAEKDARIAELTELDAACEGQRSWLITEKTAAEAKLRAVSDALDEKPIVAYEANDRGYYSAEEVDARDTRIRAIVEGK